MQKLPNQCKKCKYLYNKEYCIQKDTYIEDSVREYCDQFVFSKYISEQFKQKQTDFIDEE